MKIVLNLLSPEKKKALDAGFILTYAQTMIFILCVFSAFIAGTLMSIELLLTGTRDDLVQQTSSTIEEYDTITQQVTEINSYLNRVMDLQDQFVDWSAVVEAVTFAAPEGTRLDSVRIDSSGAIYIQGVARTREDVLIMEQRYKGLPFITDVRSPLSNILQRENTSFEFEMRYEPIEEEKKTTG